MRRGRHTTEPEEDHAQREMAMRGRGRNFKKAGLGEMRGGRKRYRQGGFKSHSDEEGQCEYAWGRQEDRKRHKKKHDDGTQAKRPEAENYASGLSTLERTSHRKYD